jgi:predicted phage terminase large subunit-like protein
VTAWVEDFAAALTARLGTARGWNSPLELAGDLHPGYRLRPHLEYLAARLVAALVDVELGYSRYLLISMPPRTGKSVLTSVYLPLWILQRHPDWRIMLLSHSPDLATGWGRQVRRLIEQHPALRLDLARDAGAATDWETTSGGQVLSRSIRQSITGRGAKVMLLDDIVKDFADAHSRVSRDFVWDWWTSNSRTRLEPPTLVVCVMTRWHEDDFAGRLLSTEFEGSPDQWEVIRLPAFAEEHDVLGRLPGEPLLSPLLDETPVEARVRWEDIKQAVGTYAFSALYQERPGPSKGTIFQDDWWKWWRPGDLDEYPPTRIITSWDCTFKDTDSSDFVVGQKWGQRGADRILLDQVRGRWSFTETLAQMEAFCLNTPEHLVESAANGPAVIDVLKHKIPGMIAITPKSSKESRARAITPEVEAGNVILPATAAWLPEYLAEFRAFPSSAHDDQVDATTQALLRLRDQGNVVTLLPTATVHRGFLSSKSATVGRGR